jgi:hypothetical protein
MEPSQLLLLDIEVQGVRKLLVSPGQIHPTQPSAQRPDFLRASTKKDNAGYLQVLQNRTRQLDSKFSDRTKAVFPFSEHQMGLQYGSHLNQPHPGSTTISKEGRATLNPELSHHSEPHGATHSVAWRGSGHILGTLCMGTACTLQSRSPGVLSTKSQPPSQ